MFLVEFHVLSRHSEMVDRSMMQGLRKARTNNIIESGGGILLHALVALTDE